LWDDLDDQGVDDAEAALNELGEIELLCISLNRRGCIAAERGDDRQAHELFQEVIGLCNREAGSWVQEVKAIAQGNLGVLYNRGGHWSRAVECLEPASNEVAQGSELVIIYAELSRSYSGRRKIFKARSYWQMAEKLARRLELARPVCESDRTWQFSWRGIWR
jgi:tetratricopeptide (TPR) repeat protein